MRYITDIEFRERVYKVEEWTGKENEIPVAPLVAIDTETERIVDGQRPEPVIMQVSFPSLKVVHIVHYTRMDEYIRFLLQRNPEIKLAFHNCGFDLEVMKWMSNPELKKRVVRGDVLDTGVRYYLKTLEEGTASSYYPKLAEVVKRLFKVKLDKDDDIRLTFTQGMELTDKHLEYAAKDAVVTGEALRAMPHAYPTERIQVTAVITCGAMQRNGMYVDKERFNRLKKKFKKKEKDLLRVLEVFGYIPGMKGNNTILQEILKSIEKRCGVEFDRTATKQLSTSESALLGMDVNHPFLKAFKEYSHIHKMISTYLNEDLIGKDGRVHPNFNPSVLTGRTSCSKPNVQNLPKAEGLRGQYCAPPGKVLLAIDYDQIELCSLAESNYERFGFSKQGDKINAGIDVHVDMGAQFYEMEYDDLFKLAKIEQTGEGKKKRSWGKVPNFGTRNPLNLCYTNVQSLT